jgi:hypothetical protein
MSRMSKIDAATSRYQREMAEATERAEATSRNVHARCAELIAVAEKAIAAAKAEAAGVEANAVDLAEKAIEDATRRLDQALSDAVGAPPTARITDTGVGMTLWLGSEIAGTAAPASGSFIVTVGGLSTGVGSWVAARTHLWRAARAEAERPLLAGVRA